MLCTMLCTTFAYYNYSISSVRVVMCDEFYTFSPRGSRSRSLKVVVVVVLFFLGLLLLRIHFEKMCGTGLQNQILTHLDIF